MEVQGGEVEDDNDRQIVEVFQGESVVLKMESSVKVRQELLFISIFNSLFRLWREMMSF